MVYPGEDFAEKDDTDGKDCYSENKNCNFFLIFYEF